MVTMATLVLGLLAVPVVAACAYLLVLTVASSRTAPPSAGAPRTRFDVIVPAHDEEAGIAATVRSLLAVEYPESLRRVVVVADNCTDGTAERARQAGATVLERQDATRRGKGYALDHAFQWSLAAGRADALVVVDADTDVSPNLLRAFAARVEGGAPAVQAAYGVRNPDDSWRTRLMAVALALVNTLRSLGRERLRLSVGLKGNGMCFSAAVLREVPHHAFSIVEDLEYGIRLGRAGHRVHFAAEARVLGDMAAGGEAAAIQRRRWEGGRKLLVKEQGWPLLRAGLARRDPVLVDLALDLLVPPLASVAVAALAGAALSLALSWMAGRVVAPAWAFLGGLAAIVAYVARGWWISGTGLRGLAGLLAAPAYVAWKLVLAFRSRGAGRQAWVRTPRDGGAR
jgi:cellulose synthase/poly-beta-1,6-N-acetylglucosamine synthase-like glycosyltransferase